MTDPTNVHEPVPQSAKLTAREKKWIIYDVGNSAFVLPVSYTHLDVYKRQDYYRAQGVDVREYSIGDYVLNGGEVAVSVMLEAITRLMPGFMGNPDSIVEESYTGEGLSLIHI